MTQTRKENHIYISIQLPFDFAQIDVLKYNLLKFEIHYFYKKWRDESLICGKVTETYSMIWNSLLCPKWDGCVITKSKFKLFRNHLFNVVNIEV